MSLILKWEWKRKRKSWISYNYKYFIDSNEISIKSPILFHFISHFSLNFINLRFIQEKWDVREINYYNFMKDPLFLFFSQREMKEKWKSFFLIIESFILKKIHQNILFFFIFFSQFAAFIPLHFISKLRIFMSGPFHVLLRSIHKLIQFKSHQFMNKTFHGVLNSSFTHKSNYLSL